MYLVTQQQYEEENFGNLKEVPSLIHGLFSTKELAEEWVSKKNVNTFYAQYGSGKENFNITELVIDNLVNEEKKERVFPFTAYYLQKRLTWEKFCELTGLSYYAKNEGFTIDDSEVFYIKESDIAKYNL